MGFFDLPEPLPGEDALGEPDPWDDLAPGPWIGGVVPLAPVLAISEQAVVNVSRIVAFPEGIEVSVRTALRRGVHGRESVGFWQGDPRRDGIPDEILRLGVEWPGGQRATNLAVPGLPTGGVEPDCGVDSAGGGRDGRGQTYDFWIWPLPESGDLTLVVEWPAFGIGETATSIDTGVLRDAASRAYAVWPEDADRPSHLSHVAIMNAVQSHIASGQTEP